ncbi:hypothetical protein [Lutispora sp.]|jgi:hypothetical protein|nr:hypothetical protein [Lutispora sp.]MEA4962890.1 hypothetical protein [Lutispora sp.]
MSNIKTQLKMHYINSKKSFVIFWSIILAITVFGFGIALYLRSKGYTDKFTTNNIAAVVIFGAISSMVAYNETLPYILNMGSTRKSFVFSFAAYNMLLSLVLSVIFSILSIFERLVYKMLGFTESSIGNMAVASSLSNILSSLLFCFAITLAAAAISALIASIYYLKGMMFLFGMGAVMMLLMFIPGVRMAVFDALKFIVLSFIGSGGALKMLLFSLMVFLVCYIIIYPMARVSQVKR